MEAEAEATAPHPGDSRQLRRQTRVIGPATGEAFPQAPGKQRKNEACYRKFQGNPGQFLSRSSYRAASDGLRPVYSAISHRIMANSSPLVSALVRNVADTVANRSRQEANFRGWTSVSNRNRDRGTDHDPLRLGNVKTVVARYTSGNLTCRGVEPAPEYPGPGAGYPGAPSLREQPSCGPMGGAKSPLGGTSSRSAEFWEPI